MIVMHFDPKILQWMWTGRNDLMCDRVEDGAKWYAFH